MHGEPFLRVGKRTYTCRVRAILLPASANLDRLHIANQPSYYLVRTLTTSRSLTFACQLGKPA